MAVRFLSQSTWERPWATMLFLAVAWSAIVLAINPTGEFPTNDDFAYALSVKALVRDGRFQLTDWQSSAMIAQGAWAALFCLPAGFSFTALRISTLVLGLLGVVATYLFLDHFGVGRRLSTFAALLMVFNPVYLGQANTFMTDVPFHSLLTLSSWLVVSGLDRGSTARYWIGLAVALVSIFVRQVGEGVFIGMVLAYPLARPSFRGWLTQALLPAFVAAATIRAYESAIAAAGQVPSVYFAKHEQLGIALSHLIQLRLGVLKVPMFRIPASTIYLGLFLAPLLILLASRVTRGWSASLRMAAGVGSAVLAVVAASAMEAIGAGMPLLGNILVDFGMGIRAMPGVWPQAPRTLWVLLLAAGIWGGVALVVLIASNARATWDHRRDPGVALRPWHLVFFAGVCVVLIGPAVMMYGPYFDRYLLPLIPYAIVVATGVARPGEDPWGEASIRARAIATVGLALMGVWSMGAVHDYLEWNRTRWVAARYATGKLGVEPTRLDGGFEVNNLEHFERNLYAKEDVELVPVDPATGLRLDASHVISVSPLNGRRVLASFPCRNWLPYSPGRILLLGNAKTSVPAP